MQLELKNLENKINKSYVNEEYCGECEQLDE